MKENYGSIKSEIGIKLNDQSEFIEEMANMKAKLESVSSTFKVEVRSLKSDMEDIKTKVQGSTHRLVGTPVGASWCDIFRLLLVLVRS